ncbi:hypothetical protein CVT25_001565 [Psilocybe cyanescens]|uniref:Uncharacterized protein n=1 Tax=Psilocybe cyanescens TaxID=93625 RepID=A0A409WQ31_PSICY|nr:hypothetical protein CVT25_001565 [Psilocybe cyanescens]
MDDVETGYAVSENDNASEDSQSQSVEPDLPPETISELWGYLQPCGPGPSRILFPKAVCRWSFGRKRDNNINSIVLEALKISSQHCVITYQGNNKVTVLDMSSNGTWINGKKIGKGNTVELFNGNEICFGTTIPQPENGGIFPGYIYNHSADGLPSGDFYDNFKLGFQLGKGAFAAVHAVTHKSTGMKFAVKVISQHNLHRSLLSASARLQTNTRIMREISLMKQLEHPNICKLMQVYCDESAVIYLILELVNGGDLLSLIHERGRLAERHARDITYQICDAMAYIHDQGIVHRDLKPENILVTKEDHPIAKVADFGVAKLVDGMEMLRTICGTPYYIAPELDDPNQVDGYDHKVDSWLSGSQPFDIDDEAKFKARVVNWGVLARIKGLDRPALRFVHELLQKDPRVRLALSDAHDHYWLKDHIPYHHNIAALYRSARKLQYNAAQEGVNPAAPITELVEDEQLLHDEPMMVFLAADPDAPPQAHAPLQRRITVLAKAAEGGLPIRQPSLQMIANVSRQTGYSSTGPSGTPANDEGRNKRSLVPILEEASQITSGDVEMIAANPVKTPRPARKRARVTFGSPKKASASYRAVEDVPMESPVKAPPAKPIARRSSRIRKVNGRRH